ncbi:aspartate/glutamate racemase family protein [uncultured Roseibium sp.]|uniref:aspartate/glutamate racemase family protein n=1 Tax=uncultured Roseibium sp. TaxID=1936171 RepID=UPI002611909C|nr:aspartate/glutamate racemase family protein [uncultured Roseibium sp.]
MSNRPRIAFIHATRVAMDPIETAARQHWPEAETISILEEGLSVDRAAAHELTRELSERILGLSHYAELTKSDGVLFTCSAFGSAIEAAARQSDIPVMKPNEAMFDAAFEYGDRIAMIYTFEPAATGMEQEFQEASASRGRSSQLVSHFAAKALEAKRAGDIETHDRLVAETAANIGEADVILLAQFSMASAAPLARTKTEIPVLTSPEAAITELRRRVAARSGAVAC